MATHAISRGSGPQLEDIAKDGRDEIIAVEEKEGSIVNVFSAFAAHLESGARLRRVLGLCERVETASSASIDLDETSGS